MDRLVIVDPPDVTMRFEVGRRSVGMLQLRNVMHTMPVAFTIETSDPRKYSIRPPYATIAPLGVLNVEIIMNPQDELPEAFPKCADKFTVKTVVVPGGYKTKDSVREDWFTAKKKAVFSDTGLKVTLVGGGILRDLMRRRCMAEIREVLERDPTVADAANESGDRALHVAVSMNRPELVQILLEYRVNLELKNKAGQSPLQLAAQYGESLITELLLANGADTESRNEKGRTALHHATVRGHCKVMKLLIDHGADLDAAMKDGRAAIHIAVGEGHKDCLKLLIDNGCNIDARGQDGGTVLHIAASRGQVALVKLLLHKGAFRDAKNFAGRAPWQEAGEFANGLLLDMLYLRENLHNAARKGELRNLKRFVKKGAVVDGEDQYGWTALQRAAFKGRIDLVKYLVEKGADLQHKDKEGYTPLHTAVESCQKDVVRFLLERGADVNDKSDGGITPLRIAANFNYPGIIRILVAAGALTDVLDQLDKELSHYLNSDVEEDRRSGSLEERPVRRVSSTDERCRPASKSKSGPPSRPRAVTFAC